MNTRSTVALSTLAGIALGAVAVQGIHAQVRIPTYYIAEVEVTNLDGYTKDFLPRDEQNITAFGGRILATGPRVATIEGDPPAPGSPAGTIGFGSSSCGTGRHRSTGFFWLRRRRPLLRLLLPCLACPPPGPAVPLPFVMCRPR